MSSNKNFQIIPSKIRVIPNDRVSKRLFNLTTADIQDWIEYNKTYSFIEMKNHKKFGEIGCPLR